MLNVARRLLKGALAFVGGRVDGVYGQSSGTNGDYAEGAAVDSDGNVIVSGYAPIGVGFVAKFPPNLASATWQRKQTLTNFVTYGVGLDASNNVYCIGQGTSGVTAPHIFRYDAAGGAVAWQRKLTAAESQTPFGIAVNSSGDVYVAIRNAGAANPYGTIAKYNSSGTLQWQRKLSHTYDTDVWDVALNSSGDAIGVGSFRDGADAAGNTRGTVYKYDSTGAIQWQYKIHFSVQGVWDSVSVDQVTGDNYVAGYAYIGGVVKGVIAKLDSSGTVQWHLVHPTTNCAPQGIAIDSATGNLFVCWSNDTVSCFTTSGSGALVWTRSFAGQSGVDLRGVVVAADVLHVICGIDKTSEGSNAAIVRLPCASGGTAGAYGILTTSDPGAVSYTTGSITSASAGMTDAAGGLTDAAGSFTDAAQTLTFTAF
jgi:hypothetical protein